MFEYLSINSVDCTIDMEPVASEITEQFRSVFGLFRFNLGQISLTLGLYCSASAKWVCWMDGLADRSAIVRESLRIR